MDSFHFNPEDLNREIDFLKWRTEYQIDNLRLPPSGVQKLKDLLKDDNLTPAQLLPEVEKVINSSRTFSWKLQLFVYDLPNKIYNYLGKLSWLEILIFLSICAIIFIANKKFNLKKIFLWFFKLNVNIIERLLAVISYYVPLLDIYSTYLPVTSIIVVRYPYLRLLLPDFVKASLQIYETIPFPQMLYLFVIYGLFIRTKIPRSRFVRFHMMRGVMLISFQNLVGQIFWNTLQTGNRDRIETVALICFAYVMSWILPCFWQAITHGYPRRHFMRDAIEIHLGRDGPDFKWWDRRK